MAGCFKFFVESQDEPLAKNEVVLRRALNGEHINYDLPIVRVTPQAFRPTKKDVDGVSVFRRLFSTPEEVAASGLSIRGYSVASLKRRDILKLGLSVIPDPQEDQLMGHSLIPEINTEDYKRSNDYERLKNLTSELAKLASKRIVYP